MSTMNSDRRMYLRRSRRQGNRHRQPKRPQKQFLAAWLVPVGLLLLSAVPLAFGAFRISELTRGAQVTRDNARFLSSPVPLVLHLASAGVYSILGGPNELTGALQMAPSWLINLAVAEWAICKCAALAPRTQVMRP